MKKKYELILYLEEKNVSKVLQTDLLNYLEFTNKQEEKLRHYMTGEAFLQSIP